MTSSRTRWQQWLRPAVAITHLPVRQAAAAGGGGTGGGAEADAKSRH